MERGGGENLMYMVHKEGEKGRVSVMEGRDS